MSALGDVLVLGLGRSGIATAQLLASQVDLGLVRAVTAVDSADTEELRAVARELEDLGVRVALGAAEVTGTFDTCVASPGIPPHAPLMRSAAAACDTLISEIELAFRLSRAPWVAITGTNGKTTTTSLVAHLIAGAGSGVHLVGNIGAPAIRVAQSAEPDEVLVAEVSSFQLALTDTFRPRVAVLLNITPDHVDWHGSLEAYAEDKARVFANLTSDDTAVIDVDDPGAAPWADMLEARGVRVSRVSRLVTVACGATLAGATLVLATPHGEVPLVSVDELRIKGDHNVSNALAAAAAAHAMGVHPSDIKAGLITFEPIAHRLEPAGIVSGVEYVNDSKATNPDAVLKALTAFGDRAVVLLLGGRNKGSDFGPLAQAIVARGETRAIVFGEAARDIAPALEAAGVRFERTEGLAQALAAAAASAVAGEVVALSPGCASFDEFRDYEQRGDAFKELVARMGA